MKILKRNGTYESLSFDKVLFRLKKLCNDESLGVLKTIDPDLIAQKTVSRIYNGISSSELDEEAARISIGMIENIEYSQLASRIIISNIQKNTLGKFSSVMGMLYNNNDKSDKHSPIITKEIYDIVQMYPKELDDAIDYKRDFLFDYFGYKILEKSYLFKMNGRVVERPQHLYMRVSLQIHKNDIQNVIKTYNYISQHYFTMASPTLFNSGTHMNNLSSCFLMGTEDSVSGIFKTMGDTAKISKVGGGIGIHIHNIRSKGSVIRGTNGTSDGIIPMLKVYNDISCYINQSGKRKGSFAIYLSPEHPDIFEFLDLRKNQGTEEMRARDLFLAMWIPDLFMKKVQENGDWYLMCPDECPRLNDVYGDEYEDLYNSYVEKGMYRKKIKAQEIWSKILDSQMETGTPYLLYKDSINKKSNQKNIGVIKSSNLCVSPNTMILTSEGYFPIGTLENKIVNVWNGMNFTKTVVKKTGENQKLLTVYLSNGCKLTCTYYHNFYNEHGKKIAAQDLHPGMILLNYKLPIIYNPNNNLENAYEIGKKMGLLCSLNLDEEQINDIIVPINYNLKSRVNWINGLFYESFGFYSNCGKKIVVLSSYYETFLEKVLYLLQTLGCKPYIIQGKRYELVIYDFDIQVLEELGVYFPIEYICLNDEQYEIYNVYNDNIHVKDIVFETEISNTYCFKESERGMGVFNGVLTGQCSEITLYSDDKEYAVCNLSSIALPKYVKYNEEGEPYFDHDLLYTVAKDMVLPMNNVIDYNYYPTPETKTSNFRHRPIGIGVQGLADAFIKMKYQFESDEAKKLNKEIFETIYYATLKGSMELAKRDGAYSTFENSPFSKGLLQFDLWQESDGIDLKNYLSGRWDWDALKNDIMQYGVRNSTLLTCMPTASSAQIMGNSDTIEPFDSCIYKKRVLSGEYIVANKYLVKELTDLGLWDKEMKDLIIANNGSIQNIDKIPENIKKLYKTVWEISMKHIIDMSADRSVFIDMTQSLNLFMQNPNYKKLTSMHFYAWNKKLKTGMYYLRQNVITPGKFNIDPELEKKLRENKKDEEKNDNDNNKDNNDCVMCSA